jgi:hypothetical protein
MILPFLFLISPLFAATDLSAINELENKLPDYTTEKQSDEEIKYQRQNRRFTPPYYIVSMEEIKRSEVQYGALKIGSTVIHIETNELHKNAEMKYVKYFSVEDEKGFKYLQNKDGSVTWKVPSRFIDPLKNELSMYVPPDKYTPAPKNLVKTVYDRKLKVLPEFSFYAGLVQGQYMKDLFEDKRALIGTSNQYGIQLFTDWNLPIKAGVVVHYEKASYRLQGGGQVFYTSTSIGPQIKTKDFDFFGAPIRFQTQLRIGPVARASAETIFGNGTFKFNSTDLLVSIERPFKNDWGEFVLGFYSQSQWLNLVNQEVNVSLKASNAINRSYGLSIAQVFE